MADSSNTRQQEALAAYKRVSVFSPILGDGVEWSEGVSNPMLMDVMALSPLVARLTGQL